MDKNEERMKRWMKMKKDEKMDENERKDGKMDENEKRMKTWIKMKMGSDFIFSYLSIYT